METISALYTGWVSHRRLRPVHHAFRYRVFSLLIDLSELPDLAVGLRLFAWNRWGVFSFHDRDHGDGRPLQAWTDAVLAGAGITANGPRQVLCYPRIFGYVFNPLSVWFCRDEQGSLQAVIYEVHNTFGERHAYVLPANSGELLRHGCAKGFYVSPFLSPQCRYQFRVSPPSNDVAVAIREQEDGVPTLNASFAGRRRPLDDRALFAMLWRYPLMTLKIILAIHFEAVRLVLKGLRRHRHAPQNRAAGLSAPPA